jgi:hypothetical protein
MIAHIASLPSFLIAASLARRKRAQIKAGFQKED